MAENPNLNVESPGVRTHITVMQGVIQRMAENSGSCKIWCITIVAAVLVLVSRTENSNHALIALVPAFLFLILDIYYLALEQSFRSSYNVFVETLHKGELSASALYDVKPSGSIWHHTWKSMRSFSIWPFYLPLGLTVVIVWQVMIP